MPKHLIVATKNAHKTAEIRGILGSDWTVEDLTAYSNIPAPDETGDTFEANAIIKAEAAAECFDGWVLSDDSGLEVDALNGEPGEQSALYAGEHGNDAANRAKLLQKLAPLRADQSVFSARFRCVMALVKKGETPKTFSGAVEGRIIDAERGEGGFGYDSLFVPEGYEQTFAELSGEVKNQLSHRARALQGVKTAVLIVES